MADDSIFDGLREKLSLYTFPTKFPFKLIFPIEKLEEVKQVFDGKDPFDYRPSKEGNYLSITCHARMNSVEAIIDIYKKAAKIKGVISL